MICAEENIVQAQKSPKRFSSTLLPVAAILLTLALVLSVCSYALLGLIAKPTVKTIEADISAEFSNIPAIESAVAVSAPEPVFIMGLPKSQPPVVQPVIIAPKLQAVASIPVADTVQLQAYLIMGGDTLSAIALNYDVPLEDIAMVNGIENINLIYTGITLLIPQKSANKVVVKRGESLFSLATKHNTTVAELVKINNLSNPNILYAGQGLVVPGK
jgi:LysM repeat protein